MKPMRFGKWKTGKPTRSGYYWVAWWHSSMGWIAEMIRFSLDEAKSIPKSYLYPFWAAASTRAPSTKKLPDGSDYDQYDYAGHLPIKTETVRKQLRADLMQHMSGSRKHKIEWLREKVCPELFPSLTRNEQIPWRS